MKSKLLILFFCFFVTAFFSLKYVSKPYKNTNTILGRISNIVNENNTINLTCNGVSKENIDLTWGERIIVKNGIKIQSIGYKYGKNVFVLKIGNLFQEKLFHYKTNNWHSHDYQIQVLKTNAEQYEIVFKAKGPDKEEYTIEVIP